MAFKQPRVPEYREREGADRYIRSLVLFLKDFCMDVWTANNQRTGEIESIRGSMTQVDYPVTSVCGKTGEVALTAEDVGARPGDWTPAASDVGALAADGTAADSSKLGGKTWAERLLDIYPIGSIYMSTTSTSPASLFGGTWEQMKDRFLLGAGSSYAAGSTGGEAAHTLTVSEMPSHSHTYMIPGYDSGTEWYGKNGTAKGASQNSGGSGGGNAHNNMPPYLAVYMWKRVS